MDEFRETEVEDFHEAVVRDDHVLRLQIAMHDAALVRGGESVGDFAGDAQNIFQRHRAVGGELAKIASFDELHGDVRDRIAAPDVVDRDDARMIQRRCRARFELEAAEMITARRQLGRENFQRDVALELRIARAINLAHAAGADRRDDLVRTDSRSRSE